MTIKAFFLNRLKIYKTGSVWGLIFYLLGNTFLIGNCLAHSAISPKEAYYARREADLFKMAQNNSSLLKNPLPPPPPLSPPNIIIKTQESLSTPDNIESPRGIVQNSQEEYIFSAPTSTTTTYKVEVFGKSNFVLKQVREVEPKAFIKGNIIQVGIFSEEDNAMDLVKQLILKGLWARIVVE